MTTPHTPSLHPSEPTQRITSKPMTDMRPEWLATLARIPGKGLHGDGFPKHVLGVIMHNPDTFGPFLDYWVTCKLAMGLSVREQELVILRMAVLYSSDYVWKHHVPLGIEFGMTDSEFNAVRTGSFQNAFNTRELALLTLTDELVQQRTIRPEVWHTHHAELQDRDRVDLVHLVAQYVLFALMNNAMQVQIEPALDTIPSLQ